MEGQVFKVSNGELDYYGSTTINLRQKLACIKYNALSGKNRITEPLFQSGKVDIYLVENCPVESMKEREKHYILNEPNINLRVPHRGRREYYEANKTKILEGMKEQKKKYYEKNKDIIKKKNLERYYAKKAELSA